MKKGNFLALLPILIFLILFIGVGVATGDMYTMPAVVGFLIALAVAFLQNRKVKFAEKMQIAARSMGEENIVTMLLIFLVAGAFSGIVSGAELKALLISDSLSFRQILWLSVSL